MEYRYRDASEMKDSGVEWIGEIPKDWEVTRLKNLVTIITGNTPSKNNENNYKDGYIPWIKPDNITEEFKITESKEKLSYEGAKQARIIPKNSALVCCIGTVGKVGVNEYECATNQQINSIIFNKKLWRNKYGIYTLIASRKEHERNSNKVVVSILNKNQQGNIYMPIMNLNEQEKIANFLDKKTSQFDSIISKKEALIEKLEEAKKSLISEVVTGKVKVVKTDDGYELVKRSSDEMKDSGVEWLGDIPNDWKLKKSKYFSEVFIPQRNKPEFNTKADGIPWITTEDLNDEYVNITKETYYVDNEAQLKAGSKILNHDSVITTCVGTFGISSINRQKVIINQQLQAFTKLKIDKNYLNYFLKLIGPYFESIATETTIKYVNREKFENTKVTYPDMIEQKIIVEFLNLELNKIKGLIYRTKIQIEKLKEAKQSLISEAVTGKIEILD